MTVVRVVGQAWGRRKHTDGRAVREFGIAFTFESMGGAGSVLGRVLSG
jgi:hypothetical protein